MQITGIHIRPLLPPKDSLLEAIKASKISPKDGDVIVISSKVVSIQEGTTIPIEAVKDKDQLVREESDFYFQAPKSSRYRKLFTIAKGVIVGSAGVDESNGNDHYILYPRDPFASARKLRTWFMKEYGVSEIAIVITDSTSIPLRRGAIGFALAWDGIDPLRDYRGTKDIFGRVIKIEMANLVDSLAAAAVLAMGEGDELIPVVVVRGVQNVVFKNRSPKADQLMVTPEDDLFAPLLWKGRKWKGGTK